ncbi:hypothetical protein C7B61_16480 [filamentous cyanobacterium CCP1]|nr:hypothetical protein C7B61_16480 [filamentous cyanobacterium CCP1]
MQTDHPLDTNSIQHDGAVIAARRSLSSQMPLLQLTMTAFLHSSSTFGTHYPGFLTPVAAAGT